MYVLLHFEVLYCVEFNIKINLCDKQQECEHFDSLLQNGFFPFFIFLYVVNPGFFEKICESPEVSEDK